MLDFRIDDVPLFVKGIFLSVSISGDLLPCKNKKSTVSEFSDVINGFLSFLNENLSPKDRIYFSSSIY